MQEAVRDQLQLGGVPVWRERDDDPLRRREPLGGLDGRDEVAVARHQDGGVVAVLYCVLDQAYRNVDVGLLLLEHGPLVAAGPASAALLKEPAVHDVHQWAVARQSVEVVSLPLKGIGVVTHTSREVGDTLEYLTGAQQAHSKRLKIKPQVLPSMPGPQPIVQVEAIDVDRDSVHSRPPVLERRPWCTLETPRQGE